MMKSTNYLPFHLGYLTSEMIATAEKELNENENTRSSAIRKLRELILDEKNLKCPTNDEFLLQFLRASKFRVNKSLYCLKNLYNAFCNSYSDVFAHHDVRVTREAIKGGIAAPLPYRDEEGAPVLLVKISKWDTSKHDTIGVFNLVAATVLAALDDPATQVCGIQFIVDVSGTTLQHVRCLTPRYLYLVSKGLQNSAPVRYKAIHLFNSSAVFRYIWMVVKVFLTDKIRKRIHFHKDTESLHHLIPKAILPAEYGGEIADFDPSEWSARELDNFLPRYLKLINHSSISD